MKKTFLFATALAALSMFCSCKDEIEMRYPPKYELPELPTVEGIHENQKAPLYWSVYENCYLQERQGHTGEDSTSARPSGTTSSTGLPPTSSPMATT